VVAGLASHADAASADEGRRTPATSPAASIDAKRKQALTEDLRYGHVVGSVGAGLWVPSASFAPTGAGLTAPAVGLELRARLGLAFSGYVVGFAEGSVARATGKTGCEACATTSLTAGLGVSAHLAQGFAADPWVSFGVAYRDTLLTVDDVPRAVSDAPVHGIDFARVAMGFDHAPLPWLGLGPFVASNVGVRLFDGEVYADFVAGLRVTFDPSSSARRLVIDGAR